MRASCSAHSSTLRVGSGVLIIIAHLVLLALLICYAGTPPIRGEAGPANYIALTLVQVKTKPRPAQAQAEKAPSTPRKRVAPVQPAPVAAQAPSAAQEAPEAEPGHAPQQGYRLDMDALRADARRFAGDHIPEPFEQVRDAEHRLEADKNDLGRAISNAKREPCTKRYSGGTSMNLFALIPLAIDTITDTGCKW